MKDLSDRFAQDDAKPQAEAPRVDPLARLHEAAPQAPVERTAPSPWLAALRGRADIVAASCAVLAVALALWPLLYPAQVHLPAVADTGDEVATLTVRPLTTDGVAAAPDWYGLFNAYQLETSLRDISIRCAYGLPSDARVDRYLHAKLAVGTEIRIFLADPETCPKT